MSLAPQVIAVYDQPHQFEPLLPALKIDELAVMARPVIESALKLQGATNVHTRTELRALVRSMNSYYSNLIEGQSTHPVNIDRALKQDFSEKPDIAKKQRIALAHIAAEKDLEAAQLTEQQALSSGCLAMAHRLLYGHLSLDDRTSDEGHLITPGEVRQCDVVVHRHHPPSWQSVPAFLARADQTYSKQWGLDRLLVAVAASHHRYAWVHPFVDGNGRACRLQLHAAMSTLTGGLWSVNRGLARNRDQYYVRLSEADMPRHGDLDGRGNLSEKMLFEWCAFFIQTCVDQASFMASTLELDKLKERIAALVVIRGQTSPSEYKKEAILALHHVLAVGPVSRGEFVQLTGLAERTGRVVMSKLLKDGLLKSDTAKGEVRIGFPIDSLNILLPNLYPEASTAVRD